ncbi:MAG: hypothetical protein L0287_10135 [Anaerolineae bacterium]|nr:hypothetical protein [Anaerolineae bacterium]
MKNLDGKSLSDFKQWRCSRNKDHILGVIERVKISLQANGSTLKYYTTRLLVFRQAVDLSADVPGEIEVSGSLDGRILNMLWRCSVLGCGCVEEWHPDKEIIEYLVNTYHAE